MQFMALVLDCLLIRAHPQVENSALGFDMVASSSRKDHTLTHSFRHTKTCTFCYIHSLPNHRRRTPLKCAAQPSPSPTRFPYGCGAYMESLVGVASETVGVLSAGAVS